MRQILPAVNLRQRQLQQFILPGMAVGMGQKDGAILLPEKIRPRGVEIVEGPGEKPEASRKKLHIGVHQQQSLAMGLPDAPVERRPVSGIVVQKNGSDACQAADRLPLFRIGKTVADADLTNPFPLQRLHKTGKIGGGSVVDDDGRDHHNADAIIS